MPDRRDFLKSALLPAGAFCLSPALALATKESDKNYTPLSQRIRSITPKTVWTLVQQIKISFKTFHCQGMVKIDNTFWVSSVEITIKPDGTPDRSNGKGHLFKIDMNGNLLADIPVGEGSIFHPSGIDYDGRYIWIAAAEYRPDSHAIVYRFDPQSMQLREIFRWPDHLGCICRNTSTNTLHAASWGSRKWYQWPLDKNNLPTKQSASTQQPILNPSFYIDYQDNQYLGNNEILYTGLSVYKKADSSLFALGGMEIVDSGLQTPVHQTPVQLYSPATGDIITKNPSFFELTPASKVRAYFIPDDNDSHIFLYEAE